VFSVATLNLWPTQEAAEARWREKLAGVAAVEIGVGTLAQLVAAADEPVGVRLGRLGERLLVDEVANEAGAPLARIARSRGLRRSLRRIFSSLRKVGVSAEKFSGAARAVGGTAREVARLYGEYERRLGDCFDEAEAWRRGCARLAAGVALRELEGVDRVEVRGVHQWDGARLLALDALLQRGLPVSVVLPEAAAPALQRALAPTLAALESRHEAALDVVRQPLSPTRPGLVCAATPFAEAREVARRARDLADAGVAPESIVICAESEPRRSLIAESLARYGLPVAERRRAPASSAPPVRLALSLYDLADERIARSKLIALASSRYLAPGEIPAHRLARIMREAGVLDAEAWEEPLAAWVARHPDSRQRDGERGARRLSELMRVLRALPPTGTWGEHAAALRRSLDELELPERTRGFSSEPHGNAETRALARDQAALRALELTLDDLPRAAARLGLSRREVMRARFSRLLEDALLAEELRSSGVRGGAVEVTDLASLAERKPAHLMICGLVEGELPSRAPEDPLLGDDEKLRLNRVLGTPALPLDGGAEDRAALAFACALQGEVTVTWTRTDEEGAPQLRSPLIDELGVKEKEILQIARDPLPKVAEARTLDELTARVALEVRGDRHSRLSAPDREASTELYRLLGARAPARLARLEHLAEIERRRERFFSGLLGPHIAVGELREPGLLAALRLPGRKERPLSASAVESYASCPFQFFVRAVLDAAPVEEVDEELDPLAAGRLYHRVLERIFRRLADENRFPLRGDLVERTLVSEACDEAVAEWKRTNPVGHPALFEVWARRLRRQIEALIESERRRPVSPGCTPARFEARFGPLAVKDGDEVIYLHGLIDRIDVGPDRAVVLDYKTGARQQYSKHVAPAALCVTAWQLPIYAAAARAELGPGHHIEAKFYSLRDQQTTKAVEGNDLVALDDLGRARARAEGMPNLGDKLWQLHRTMRGGNFTVDPREDACDRCNLEAACRVMRTAEEAAEEEP
jgi:hypothetical protein